MYKVVIYNGNYSLTTRSKGLIRMGESTFFLETSDEKRIFVRTWVPTITETPMAVVQIAHGMAEHSARYHSFAAALNQQGIAVYANDHRGHGKTEENPQDRGHFGDYLGWELAIQDLSLLTDHIKKMHPNVPVYLFGHSLGSFLVRRYIQLYNREMAGVIISGTGGHPGIQGKLGGIITKVIIRNRGTRFRSSMINNLIFGKYNQNFKPNRTSYDWLSRDEREVDKYMKDELCGYLCTVGFIGDMIAGIIELHRNEHIRKIPKDLPIYMFSGAKDPLGKNGKAVIEVAEQYKKLGMQDVIYKLYKDGRHEMLNEVNREEVYQDVIQWIQSKT